MNFLRKLFWYSSPTGEIRQIETIQKIPYIWDSFEEQKKKEVFPNYQDLTTCPYCGTAGQKPFMRKRKCKFCKNPVFSTQKYAYTEEQMEQIKDNSWFDQMEEHVANYKKQSVYKKIRSRFSSETEYDCIVAFLMFEIEESEHYYQYDAIGRQYSGLWEYLWYMGNYRAAYFCKMLSWVMSAGEWWIYHYSFTRGREIAKKHHLNIQELNDKVAMAFKDICSYFGFSEQFDILPWLVELDQKELMVFEYGSEEGRALLKNIHEEYRDKTLELMWEAYWWPRPLYLAKKYF